MTEKKEYIERRSALEEFNDLIRQTCNKPVPPLKVKRMIENLDAADAVQVVRCKDCKFYLPQENGIGVCGIHDYGTELNDFCSFGEQREGERE